MAAAAAWQPPASAVQGLTAGRIPGVTGPDPDGYMTYTRPEGKSGGHGVGWTEIQRYSFKVPQSWEETPVSIADLGCGRLPPLQQPPMAYGRLLQQPPAEKAACRGLLHLSPLDC
jgi:hypothetical protein